MSKYHAKPVFILGERFDSKKEAERYMELVMLERVGEIRDLQRQVKFQLIPEQREVTTEVFSKGPNKGMPKKGKVIEKECSYIADFTYLDSLGNFIVEDTKGFQTKDFIIKRKLMLWLKGIRIKLT